MFSQLQSKISAFSKPSQVPEKRYEPLTDSERGDECDMSTLERARTRTRYSWKTFCVLAGILNLMLLAYIVFGHSYHIYISRLDEAPKSLPKPIFEPNVEYLKLWNHDATANFTANDEFWDQLLPGHGLVAVDRHWAKSRNWAESVYLPSDHSKGVYALEAYHQLHCLRTIRSTFWEAHDGKKITWPHYHGHMEHCFEGLRQAIMCNADNTALFTFGGDTIGHGQLRKCHSWDQLRDWATEHSACYNVDPAEMLSVIDLVLVTMDSTAWCTGSEGLVKVRVFRGSSSFFPKYTLV